MKKILKYHPASVNCFEIKMEIDTVWVIQDNEYGHASAGSKYQCGVGSDSRLWILHGLSKGWSLAFWESLTHSHLTQWGEDFGCGSKSSFVWAVPMALVEEGAEEAPFLWGLWLVLFSGQSWQSLEERQRDVLQSRQALVWLPSLLAAALVLNKPSLYQTLTAMELGMPKTAIMIIFCSTNVIFLSVWHLNADLWEGGQIDIKASM